MAFVSHAHADHFARHQRIICSVPTAELLRARFGTAGGRLDPRPYGEAWEEGGWRFLLQPAGHVLGSAMLHATRIEDGASLLYTGDFKLRASLTAEATVPVAADLLVMECTFGLPRYVFPPRDEVWPMVMAFVRDALSEGAVPLLAAYSLGKAQEVVAVLGEAGIPVMGHDSVHQALAAYGRHSPTALPVVAPWQMDQAVGHAVVAPPAVLRSRAVRNLRPRVTAMLSGWALDAGAAFRYQVDAAFPISDHADYPELVRMVEAVNPRRVLLVHGYQREFAAALRTRGVEAWSSLGNDQLELAVGAGESSLEAEAPAPEAGNRSDSFCRWVDACEAVAEVPGRGEKVARLANLLADLDDADARIAVRFLAGRPLGRRSGRIRTGWATLRRALIEATGMPAARFKALSRTQADAARTARLALMEGDGRAEPWSLAQAEAFLDGLAALPGAMARLGVLVDRLRRLAAVDGAALVALLTGEMRSGLKVGLLEEAVARAFGADAAQVRRAHMLTGDMGEVAGLARVGMLATATLTPGVPVQVMLASPEPDAEAVVARLGGSGGLWVEDKYDGIRAQLHRSEDAVGLFSRDLRDLGEEFPELVEAAQRMPDHVVMDGEVIAYAEGKKLGFGDLQKRLGRRTGQGDLFLGQAVPVRFLAFDCLWHDGTALIDEPLRERRTHLEALRLPDGFEVVPVRRADDAAALREAFRAARDRDNEGLIVKDPDSPYTPGRRGKTWVKLKTAGVALDVVVVRVEQGHGRRAHLLSDYTFAVRDEATGGLSVVGKAYSGLTDVEIEELTAHFREHTLAEDGRVREVVPDTVLEVVCDRLQPSKRHPSGVAMRFPRIRAIRRDKRVEDIDTLETARRLAGVG